MDLYACVDPNGTATRVYVNDAPPGPHRAAVRGTPAIPPTVCPACGQDIDAAAGPDRLVANIDWNGTDHTFDLDGVYLNIEVVETLDAVAPVDPQAPVDPSSPPPLPAVDADAPPDPTVTQAVPVASIEDGIALAELVAAVHPEVVPGYQAPITATAVATDPAVPVGSEKSPLRRDDDAVAVVPDDENDREPTPVPVPVNDEDRPLSPPAGEHRRPGDRGQTTRPAKTDALDGQTSKPAGTHGEPSKPTAAAARKRAATAVKAAAAKAKGK